MSVVDLAVKTIKALTMDAVEAATCGHPGMPMGMADAATVLWTRFLKFDPDDPHWPDRDRFVLSAGHGSMLLYSLLHLTGFEDMTLDELKNFRQWGSRTAGHPEYKHAEGIETTTGPLGQGFGNAVGMALAERLMAERFNTERATLVDHYTYVIAGDGDMMEGVAQEAASLAGHLALGRLIVLYDDNGITIDGETDLAFSEDVPARFEALGWHAQRIDGHDREAVEAAIEAARAETGRPSLIACRTHIGHGAPTKQDTSDAHGSALGAGEVRATKEAMGWPSDEPFHVPDEVRHFFGEAADRGRAARRQWQELRRAADGELLERFDAQLGDLIPEAIWEKLPTTEPGKSIATRKASNAALNAIAESLPQLLGGSADLTGSNGTELKGFGSVTRGDFGPDRRNMRYGVREHGMAAIMNGVALHGGFRPFGGTFLVFSDYMRPSMRLAALMRVPTIFVLSHDSVFLGEDGPTHQPIEHTMSLRLIPNLQVIRPADANETALAWRMALDHKTGPTALLLTRQNVDALEVDHDGVLRGGYIIRHEQGSEPKVILIATGSEVQVAMGAAELLGPDVRVVSMPCWEIFEAQDDAYRHTVLPLDCTARAAIEAGVTMGWQRWIGPQGTVWGIDRFGASAPAERIAEEWGFTPEAFAAHVRDHFDL